MKATRNYRFINWGKNQTCTAENFLQPQTEAEIIEAVKTSNKIRVVGTGHSWSAICLTDHSLINFDLYNKVLNINKEKLQVTVQSGIKLWQLNGLLDKEGLALRNLGSISDQSLAGAISTATHGTGINYPILGSQIQQLSIIKANGEKLVLDCVFDAEVFNTALVSLGALGILSEITLNVVPAFNLNEQNYVTKFDDVIDKLDEFVADTDHFKLWWFPHVDEVVVYNYRRTHEPANDSRFRQWLMDEVLSVLVYRILIRMGHINRNWRKWINKLLVTKLIMPLNRIEKSYQVFNVPAPPPHRETEWAFDIRIAKDLLREYKQMINTSEHRINFLQEIRFTKGDSYTLSPCNGRNTIWLGVYNADNYGWDTLLADFEQLAKRYNGRPHWGKEFNADSIYISTQYSGVEKFNALRKEWDPEGKFENDYIAKLFA